MGTDKQNNNLHTWFNDTLQLNDQSILSMKDLYGHYCGDLRYKSKKGINV